MTTPRNTAPSQRPRVTVVIPTLNEERNLPFVAARMPAVVDEVVVVDGHSVDRTVEVAQRLWPDVIVVAQSRIGKGNALACGFGAATGDIIVMLDADCSNDPAEIPQFVGALTAGADFAKGSRFIAGGGSADITRFRRVGNWGLSTFVNVLFRTRYTDLCYGYNAFWRHALPTMALPDIGKPQPRWGDGFEVEALINIRVAAAGLKVAEVCSFERNRRFGESNLNAIRDGLRVLGTIVEEFIDHRRAAKAPKPRRSAALVSNAGVAVAATTLTAEGV